MLHEIPPRTERLRRPAIAHGRTGEDSRDRHRPRFQRPRRKWRELQFRRAPLPQSVSQRAPQHFVHERLLEKPHFRFRRVNVDVHSIGRYLNEEVHLGAALFDRRDTVRLGNCMGDRAVLDDAAVDEHVLRTAHRALVAECGNVAVNLQSRGFLANLDQIEALPKQLIEPRSQTVGRWTLDQFAAAARE